MKTVADYIQLLEDAMPVNTISSGAIATKDVPLGAVKKRKVEESENQIDESKKEIASYANRTGNVVAKVFHDRKTSKYHVKNFFKGHHYHQYDSTHDDENEAHKTASKGIRRTSDSSVAIHPSHKHLIGSYKAPIKESAEELDEAKMNDIATYRNKVAVQAKIYHNPKSGKYHVKHFLNGSNKHSHDDTHDTEEAAHAAAKRRYPNTTPEFSKMMRESGAYDGENPLGDAAGKMPLMGVQAPDMEVSKEKQLSNLKQSSQQNYS